MNQEETTNQQTFCCTAEYCMRADTGAGEISDLKIIQIIKSFNEEADNDNAITAFMPG